MARAQAFKKKQIKRKKVTVNSKELTSWSVHLSISTLSHSLLFTLVHLML
jgi:hypothetical protein